MRSLLRAPLVLAVTLGVAPLAAYGPAYADDAARIAKTRHKAAARLRAEGEYAQALASIAEGLAAAPGDLALLQLRAATLFEMRDYEGALAAYEAFLAAGPRGANKRAAQRIVANLAVVRTTLLDLTVAGASADEPASVYLDTRSLGVFCVAAPRCTRGLLPDDYKLIVERPGHDKLTERVTVVGGQTLTLERALVELPSAVTIGASAPATVVVDGKELGAAPQALTAAAGDHEVELRAPGYVTARASFTARRGQPVELTVALRPLVPYVIDGPAAGDVEVWLGDAPAPVEAGALALPDGALTLTVRARGFLPADVEVPAQRPDGYRIALALAPAPAPLTVEGAPRGAVVSVDGQVAGTVPLAAPLALARGERAVEVTAPGRAALRTKVTVASDAPLRLDVTRMPSTGRRWAWVAAAGTGAVLATSGVLGLMALSREAEFDDVTQQPGVAASDPQVRSLVEEGDRYALLADVGLALGVAGVGVTAWLFVTEGRGTSAGRIAPVVTPDAVGITGSF